MGLTDEVLFWDAERVARELLSSNHPHLSGITFERLKEERSIKLSLLQPYRPYADGGHFADKKIRFSPAPAQLTFDEMPSERFPLRLISPPGSHVLNTSMGNIPALLKAAGGEPQIVVHPADAARSGLRHGGRSRVVSAHSEIIRKTLISPDAREGVAVALGQWWPKLAPDKKSLNDLTGECLTDLGGGSTFGNATVVFVDEVGSSLKGVVGTTWAPAGQTPEVSHCCKWDKLSTIGGISHDGRVFSHSYAHSICKEQVVAFLEQLAKQLSGKLLVIWDGASIHRAHVVEEYLQSQEGSRITLLNLPPYAPECNPIDWLWA